MSFWTDLRDVVTTPVRSVVDFVDDIFSGENFFESIGDLVGKNISVGVAPIAIIDDIKPVGKLFDEIDPLTGGLLGNFTDAGDAALQIARDNDVKKDVFERFIKSQAKGAAKTGAAILTANALAPTAGVVTQAGAGALGSNIGGRLIEGDIEGAISLAAASGGLKKVVPDELSDAFEEARNFVKNARGLQGSGSQTPVNNQPIVSEFASVNGGRDFDASDPILAVIVLAGSAFLIAGIVSK